MVENCVMEEENFNVRYKRPDNCLFLQLRKVLQGYVEKFLFWMFGFMLYVVFVKVPIYVNLTLSAKWKFWERGGVLLYQWGEKLHESAGRNMERDGERRRGATVWRGVDDGTSVEQHCVSSVSRHCSVSFIYIPITTMRRKLCEEENILEKVKWYRRMEWDWS